VYTSMNMGPISFWVWCQIFVQTSRFDS